MTNETAQITAVKVPRPPQPSLRRRVFIALENQPTGTLANQIVRSVLMAAIMISVTAVMLSTVPEFYGRFAGIFLAIEYAALLIFAIEYVLRVWVSVEARQSGYTHPFFGRLRYMATPMAVIDLIAFAPMLIAPELLTLRLIRLIGMFKLVRYSPALATLGAVLYNERKAALAAFSIIGIAICVLSTIIWIVEAEAQPDAFGSIPAAMWWSVATLSTIGYGDVVPVTPLGRVIGGIAALCGVGLFALPTAILANGFAREISKQSFITTFGTVAKVPLLAHLDPALLAEITDQLQSRVVPPRYAIVRFGEAAQALYFISQGQVEVAVSGRLPGTLGAGDMFGAVELLDVTGKLSIQATTITECRILELPAEAFRDLYETHEPFRVAIQDIVRKRASAVLVHDGESADLYEAN